MRDGIRVAEKNGAGLLQYGIAPDEGLKSWLTKQSDTWVGQSK